MTRLYRSQRDKKITGLCGGLSESFNVDVTLLRLIVVISAFISFGTTVFLYVVASLVIPKESEFGSYNDPFSDDAYDEYGSTKNRYEPKGRSCFSGSHSKFKGYSRYDEPSTPKRDNIDEMMGDIEKKAMWKEIEELKAKLSKYENHEKGEK